MSSTVVAAVVGALCCVLASPYLAGLAHRAPDRGDALWWRGCGARFWRRDHLSGGAAAKSAVLAAGLGALGGAAAGMSAALPAFVVLAAVCTPLVVIDIAEHRLPDRLVITAGVAAAVLLPAAAVERHDLSAALRCGAAAAAVFAALLALALLSPQSFGLGDVKLGAVLGAYLGWFGWQYVYCGVVAGFVLGSCVALVLLCSGRASWKTAIPFGPMLILGALCVPAFDVVAAA